MGKLEKIEFFEELQRVAPSWFLTKQQTPRNPKARVGSVCETFSM